MTDTFHFIFGGIGSVIYAFPVFMTSRKTEVPFEASANFLYAVFVGIIFGGTLTSALDTRFTWLATPPHSFPLAVGLGLLANPLTPLIIDRGKAFFNLAADMLSGRFFGRNN